MLRTIPSKAMWIGKAMALGLALIVLVILLGFLAANPADAATTFVVNSTGDDGDLVFTDGSTDGKCYTGNSADPFVFAEECTLRAAIEQANVTPGADTIDFNIPTDFFGIPNANCDQSTKVCTISPESELDAIIGAVTINGYTQAGASVNTLANGTNAALKVELSGANIPSVDRNGLHIVNTSNVTVQGLIINRWSSSVRIEDGSGNKVMGDFLGTDASGSQHPGNGNGVVVVGASNTVGGTTPAARNLISGNTRGVAIYGSGNKVQGNLIGTTANGTGRLGNTLEGVLTSDSPNNTIGGAASARNVIAFNGRDGVEVVAKYGNRILSNSIHSNGELGIDLTGDGATPNDPDDPDTGANTLQNFPGISSAVTSRGSTTITGGLNSTPNSTFTIQFFSSPAPDSSGFGEGKTFIGQTSVTTNRNGNASFEFVPARSVPIGSRVTATATGVGGTSEFSRARLVERPVIEG